MRASLEVWGLDIEAQRGATWGEWPARMWFGAAWGRELADGYVPSIQYAAPDDEEEFANLVADLRVPGRMWVAHNASYDLAGVSNESQRQGMGPLGRVLVHDTNSTYHTSSGFPGKLADQAWHYDIEAKGSVDRYVWEAAYRREAWALEYVKEYNINDVIVVLALRRAKLQDGTLRPPKEWS